MAVPQPGKRVRGSRTGRPIMALLDLLGRRWTLRILWELREETPTFRDLRDRCDAMSPSVLNQRLTELREAGVVVLREEGGYVLTREGRG
ncbi:MAG: winged helix-turn-helix transcriptional regulator, partial [Deltaproteobacteria bacterium]|nr:winged helix-turn-helix transcriptional regulator [Deltaproteobacteria bacterium]